MYERLTYKVAGSAGLKDKASAKVSLFTDYDGWFAYHVATNRLAAYEDSGLSPEEVQELAEAKADGRLVVLPCKVGDVVHVVSGCLFYRDKSPYTPCEVVVFKQGKQRGTMMHLRPLCEEAVGTRYHRWFPVTSIGLTVFLTREAAEKAIVEAKRAAEEVFAEAFCDFAESNANREFERQMREGWEG